MLIPICFVELDAAYGADCWSHSLADDIEIKQGPYSQPRASILHEDGGTGVIELESSKLVMSIAMAIPRI